MKGRAKFDPFMILKYCNINLLKSSYGEITPPLWLIYRPPFYADPDPGSQKCPYGSGSGSMKVKFEKIKKILFFK